MSVTTQPNSEIYEVFRSLSAPNKRALLRSLEPLEFSRGERLFSAGDPPDALYFVRYGELAVVHGTTGAEIARIRRGSFVGEMGLINNQPRSATVVATCDSAVYRLSAEQFSSLLSNKAVQESMIATLTGRLSNMMQDKRHPLEHIFLLIDARSAVTADDSLREELHVALAEASSESCRFYVIEPKDAESTGERYVSNGDRVASVIRDSVGVYNLDRHLGVRGSRAFVWTRDADEALLRTALGRAHVVFVLMDESETSYDRVAKCRKMLGLDSNNSNSIPFEYVIDCRKHLDLLKERTISMTPGGSRIVLQRNPSYPADGAPEYGGLGKLVRRVLRRRVALALGGGGIRCMAHVGVLRAFANSRIPVDALAGTSGGAIVAGLAARNWHVDQIQDFLQSYWNRRYVYDWCIPPFHSLFGRRRMDRLVSQLELTTPIECLPCPFVAVAADLYSGKEVQIRKGDWWTAISASFAIPGIFPPVERDGHLLVDGVSVANVPIEAAEQSQADIVLAVDVSMSYDQEFRLLMEGARNIGLFGRLWRLLRFQLVMLHVMHRAMLVTADAAQTGMSTVKFLLRPQMGDIPLFGFKSITDAINRGEKEALARINEAIEVTRFGPHDY